MHMNCNESQITYTYLISFHSRAGSSCHGIFKSTPSSNSNETLSENAIMRISFKLHEKREKKWYAAYFTKFVFVFCFRLVEFFFISLITYYFTIQWNIHSMFHFMECIIYFAYAYNSRQCYKVAIIATWLSNWKDIKKSNIHCAHHPLFWIYCYFKDSFFLDAAP